MPVTMTMNDGASFICDQYLVAIQFTI